jgi:hypothetical protein
MVIGMPFAFRVVVRVAFGAFPADRRRGESVPGSFGRSPIARYRVRNAHQPVTEIVPEMIRRSKNGLAAM